MNLALVFMTRWQEKLHTLITLSQNNTKLPYLVAQPWQGAPISVSEDTNHLHQSALEKINWK